MRGNAPGIRAKIKTKAYESIHKHAKGEGSINQEWQEHVWTSIHMQG